VVVNVVVVVLVMVMVMVVPVWFIHFHLQGPEHEHIPESGLVFLVEMSMGDGGFVVRGKDQTWPVRSGRQITVAVVFDE
jgi:hypothetical protein